MKRLIYDTETTGLFPKGMHYADPKMPRIVQVAAIMVDENWESVHEVKALVHPHNFEIPEDSVKIHGITTAHAGRYGLMIKEALGLIVSLGCVADEKWAFNAQYDTHICAGEYHRLAWLQDTTPTKCAMLLAMNIMKLPGRYGNYKWPNLQEAHEFFCGSRFDKAHDALADVRATIRVMREMEKRGELK